MKLFKLPVLKHWSYLADLVVIILGIIIALSLDAWWQNKQDRKSERNYLEQLYVDFKATDSTLAVFRDYTVERYENLAGVLQIIHNDLPYDPDNLGDIIRSGFQTYAFAINDGTYKSLISSGKIGLIQNDSLRTLLASYQGRIDVDIEKLQTDYQFLLSARLTPFKLEELPSTSLVSTEWRKYFCLPEHIRHKIDYRELFTDPRFDSFIYELWFSKGAQKGFYDRLIAHTQQILHLLEAELEK